MDVGCIACLNLIIVQTFPTEWFISKPKVWLDRWIE